MPTLARFVRISNRFLLLELPEPTPGAILLRLGRIGVLLAFEPKPKSIGIAL